MKFWVQISSLVLVLVISVSCSKYQKLLKSSDYNLKYDKGVEYYNKEDYYRAIGLFEELENMFRGSERAEKIHYYMSYCYYNQGDHILAGYYFKNFSRKYPFSTHVEECEFMAAFCSYQNSPDPSLDQSYTIQAMEEMQLFMNRFPNSVHKDTCNILIDNMRDRLEIKSFRAAKLYYELGEYKAAITALKTSLNDYPDSQFREEIRYLILKSSFLLAQNSIPVRKKERYQSAIDEYYALVAEFPQSQYLKEAEDIFNNATNALKN